MSIPTNNHILLLLLQGRNLHVENPNHQPRADVDGASGSDKQELTSAATDTGSTAGNSDVLDQNLTSEITDTMNDFVLYPDNVCYHKLSSSERITLAYKYLDIPEKITGPSKRKKDEHEIVVDAKDKVIQSFPVHSVIGSAFNDYVDNFEKAAFKTLAAGEDAQKQATPASNRYDIKSGFMVAPSIEKWEFKSHNRDVPQVVAFDGNIAQIKADSKVPNPSNVKLTDGEWGNLQKSSSYALRAISHAAWFRESAFSALNEALPLLNPNVPENAKCIETLVDVKQFLIGLEYTFDKLASYCVYPHAGVTSILRKDFLQNESSSMLLEEQCRLFSLPYGKSFVFQGMVDTVAPQVKQHRNEIRANQQLETTTKLADQVAKQGKGPGGGGGSGYHNTRSKASNYNNSPLNSTPAYYQNKRSFSPKKGKQPFPKSHGAGRGGGPPQANNPPQGGSGKGRGGRGKSKKGN